jgi:polysaccharide export outer membrane protein
MIKIQFTFFSLLLLFCVCISSCVSSRKLTERAVYFKGISDSMLKAAPVEYEPIIQKGDILSVSVITTNERSSRFFNPVSAGSMSGGEATSANASQGYLVNEHGYITLPLIGNVRAAGLTRLALTDSVSSGLRKYIDSAIVSIRLMNYRITVLGEVVKPGTFSIPSERVSVLDAIGLAGDLTIYGKRENIRVIRNTDGMRQTAVLNLNKGDIFGSPFFYLRQNDIVYVEMNDRKIPNTDQANIRNISIALGIVSALGVIISTINVLR